MVTWYRLLSRYLISKIFRGSQILWRNGVWSSRLEFFFQFYRLIWQSYRWLNFWRGNLWCFFLLVFYLSHLNLVRRHINRLQILVWTFLILLFDLYLIIRGQHLWMRRDTLWLVRAIPLDPLSLTLALNLSLLLIPYLFLLKYLLRLLYQFLYLLMTYCAWGLLIWAEVLVIIVDLGLVEVYCDELVLFRGLGEVREEGLLIFYEDLLWDRHFDLLFAWRSFFCYLFCLLDSGWLWPILPFRKLMRLYQILPTHRSLLILLLLLTNSISFIHHLRMRHLLIDLLVPIQVLLDELAEVEHWLLLYFDLEFAYCGFALGQVESLAVFLREEVAHVVAVFGYELVFYCSLHVVYPRFLHLDGVWTVVCLADGGLVGLRFRGAYAFLEVCCTC